MLVVDDTSVGSGVKSSGVAAPGVSEVVDVVRCGAGCKASAVYVPGGSEDEEVAGSVSCDPGNKTSADDAHDAVLSSCDVVGVGAGVMSVEDLVV